jgi:dihydroneopterin aldolase
MKHVLKIQDYEVWVSLGCLADEQSYPQPVLISLDLEYATLVKGAASDELQDATDYVMLTRIMNQVAKSKSFKLIEHLNDSIMNSILHELRLNYFKGKVRLAVKKVRVPVENLRNGVVFTCETEL